MTVKVNRRTAQILSGQTVSDTVDLTGQVVCGLSIPAAFTGTSLTFQVDNGSETFQVMADGVGADFSVTVAQGKYVKLNPNDFAGIDFLKIVSGGAEAADRDVILHVRDID